MTNANEMAQKGFDTGFTDANDNELHVGDYVRICGHIGKSFFPVAHSASSLQMKFLGMPLKNWFGKTAVTAPLSCTMTPSSAFGRLYGT